MSQSRLAIARTYQQAKRDNALPFYFFLLMIGMATLYLIILIFTF